MAFTTGTATNYHDLLDKLRIYAVAQGWTQLRWTAPASITANAELWLRGPGAGADRQVFVGFRSENNVTNGHYGWAMRGAIGFDSGQAFDAQPGVSPATYFNTWQNSIDYWFYVNDRRIIVVAKVSTTYVSLYAGFVLPFALPTEYPFPICVIGNFSTLAAYNLNNSGNRMFSDPGTDAGQIRLRTTATWRPISNASNSANTAYQASTGPASGSAVIWPNRTGRADTSTIGGDWNQRNGLAKMRPNANGQYPLFQLHVIDFGNSEWLGALDGVYTSPGFNRSTEQVVTNGGRSFRHFQNLFRSTGRDFVIIEEV